MLLARMNPQVQPENGGAGPGSEQPPRKRKEVLVVKERNGVQCLLASRDGDEQPRETWGKKIDFLLSVVVRPLVELGVEPAGLCGRCTGVSVPLRVAS